MAQRDTEGQIEPFRIPFDEDALDDLAQRLARTRLPDVLDPSGWREGMSLELLADLVDYWRDDYDWESQVERLNQFDHFTTRIDDQSIHFVHARSPHADATPLLLVHGWPGSLVEFTDVIPMLADPVSHGAEPADAFHVVAPSLPGYAYSQAPRVAGWNPTRIADAFSVLMERLGYEQYCAQGGDWGAQVATRIGARDANCAAIHLNMPIARPPDEPVELSETDKADLDALARFQRSEAGYAQLHATKPKTLGVALNDSPAGLAAWIVEKFHGWSDCDDDPLRVFTRDQLLTNVMIYWTTQTITSSMRLYREAARETAKSGPLDRVAVPTGVARFPKEVLRYPRPWVERQYNVTQWTDMPRGGHFAAMEQPELLVHDVRSFARTLHRG